MSDLTITTDMRACPKCARPIPVDVLRCQYCFHRVEPRGAAAPAPAPGPVGVAAPPTASDSAPRLVARYRDAYSIAKGVVAQGETVKAIGLAVGIAIAVIFLLAGFKVGGGAILGGILGGALFGGLFWATIHSIGVGICAAGQMLLATLDTAVNTSPHLADGQRLEAMRL